MAEGDEISAGDLVVNLTGETDLLDNVEKSITAMGDLNNRVGQFTQYMAAAVAQAQQLSGVMSTVQLAQRAATTATQSNATTTNTSAATNALQRFSYEEQAIRNRIAQMRRELREEVYNNRIQGAANERLIGDQSIPQGQRGSGMDQAVNAGISTRIRLMREEALQAEITRQIEERLFGGNTEERAVQERVGDIITENNNRLQQARRNAEAMVRIYGEASVQARNAGTQLMREVNRQTGNGEDDEDGEGGHLSHYTVRRIAFHAGQALGATGIGNDATGLLTVIDSLGAGIGVALAGFIAIATSLRGQYEESLRLRDAQIAYNEEVSKSAREWNNVAAAVKATTEPGRAFAQSAAQTADKIAEAKAEEAKRIRDEGGKGGLSYGWNELPNVFNSGVQSNNAVAADQNKQKLDLLNAQQDIADKYSEAQKTIALGRLNTESETSTESYQTAGMANGIGKQRSQLGVTNYTAQKKVEDENQDRITTLLQAQEQARLLEAKEYEARNGPIMRDGKKVAYQDQGPTSDQQKAIADLEKENNIRRATEQANGLARQAELEAQAAQERLGILSNYQTSVLTLGKTGWNRQLAELREQNRIQQAEFIRTHVDINGKLSGTDQITLGQIKATGANAEKQAELDHIHQMSEANIQLVDRTNIATRATTPLQAAISSAARTAQYEWGLTGQALQNYVDLVKQAGQAEADRPLFESINEANISLAVTNGRMAELVANFERLKAANPDASLGVVMQATYANATATSAAWARQQIESLGTVKGKMMEIEDYQKKIREAVALGTLSADDAKALNAKKISDTGLTTPFNSGRFSSFEGGAGAGGGALIDFTAINPMRRSQVTPPPLNLPPATLATAGNAALGAVGGAIGSIFGPVGALLGSAGLSGLLNKPGSTSAAGTGFVTQGKPHAEDAAGMTLERLEAILLRIEASDKGIK